MRVVPFALFISALCLRLVVVQLWRIPQFAYIPVELLLIGSALYFERDRLEDFYIRFDQIRADLAWGVFCGVLFCIFESIHLHFMDGISREFKFETVLLIPVGILIAGWRAGVYEELLFRSLAMGYARRWTNLPVVAVVVQGLLFWIAHIRYFNSEGYWGIPSLVFGLALGALTTYRRSVFPAMIVHSIGNSYGGATLAPAEYLGKALKSWL
ncbi:MAG: CPBP family intramembrane glutamic endopeptidase [Bdellovibrionales bacterium]